jgi:hypothetical protein
MLVNYLFTIQHSVTSHKTLFSFSIIFQSHIEPFLYFGFFLRVKIKSSMHKHAGRYFKLFWGGLGGDNAEDAGLLLVI